MFVLAMTHASAELGLEVFVGLFMMLGLYLTTGKRAEGRSPEKLAAMRRARVFGIGWMLLIAARLITGV